MQPQSSSSSQQNPWQPQSSSSNNPWVDVQPVSSSSQVADLEINPNLPTEGPADPIEIIDPFQPYDPAAIKQNRDIKLQKKSRGTVNAKGERVNKANASRYRVDFEL